MGKNDVKIIQHFVAINIINTFHKEHKIFFKIYGTFNNNINMERGEGAYW